MDINRLFEENKGKEEEKYELIKRKSPSISARASNVAGVRQQDLTCKIMIINKLYEIQIEKYYHRYYLMNSIDLPEVTRKTSTRIF